MAFPVVKTRTELVQEAIQRVIAATPVLTYFGGNGVTRALIEAIAGIAAYTGLLYTALLRRWTLQASDGDQLDQVAVEAGTVRRAATRAKVLVAFRPLRVPWLSITSGPTDFLEVPTGGPWLPGASIRVTNADGSITETATILSVSVGTGAGGGDELEVATLAGAYSPAAGGCAVIHRATVPPGSTVSGNGVTFELLEAVSVGDRNPVLAGEGAAGLALVDKGWCEAQTAGAAAMVPAAALTTLAPAVVGVVSASNLVPSVGGADREEDFALKRRVATSGQAGAQETLAWAEALAQLGDADVLRVARTVATAVNTLSLAVLGRGGPLAAGQLAALNDFIAARVRSGFDVDCQNMQLTSVEVEAVVTLRPGYTLLAVYTAAATRLTDYLDLRKWEIGVEVEEADLLIVVRQTPGVGGLDTATFAPSSNVAVASDSLPALSRLKLTDAATGDVIDALLDYAY